jgi:NAD(P)-dependent dehydrogenase (short-subunit alcohol dehydrogenase family)
MNFKDQTVLVTGASRGIGRAIAVQFAEQGASLAVHYNRNRGAAEECLSQLKGGPHMIVQADVSVAEEIKSMVEAVIKKMDRIHVLVNNAGIFREHPVPSLNYEEWQDAWRRTIDTNLIGSANAAFLVARHMIEKGGGKIVNVTSRGAFRGEPDAPAYGASKAGQNALSQSLAKALAPHNIYICAVAPGWVKTDMAEEALASPEGDAIRNQSPMGRVATPEEVAKAVVFLSSEGTDYLTGCIVDINGASYLRT